MKHIKWNSIGQFREAIRHVRSKAEFKGLDDNGNPIMDRNAVLPKIKYMASTKIHGTNGAIGYDPKTCTIWAQSRENIITPEKDNAGFAMFMESKRDYLEKVFTSLSYEDAVGLIIFGEWAGKGIQKGVAVSELEKTFYVFSIVSIDNDGNKFYWDPVDVKFFMSENKESNIDCIFNYPTWEFEIDFEHPEIVQNDMIKLVEAIEAECPVGKAHGISGVGEGIVLFPIDERRHDAGYCFKIKGVRHANSKVKTLAPIDVEKMNSIKELAESVATENRLEQMKQQVFGIGDDQDVDVKRMGEFIKAVMTDIWKEEKDTIVESGFTMKEVNGPISKIARDYLMKNI